MTWNPGNVYNYKLASAHTITGQHTPTRDLGKFARLIQHLQSASYLTQDERQALAFGHHFMYKSGLMGAFSDSAQQQDVAIKRITLLLQVPSENAQYVRLELIRLVGCAIDNHEIMVTSTVMLETASQLEFLDRRNKLLIWIRGTRIFLKPLSPVNLPALPNLLSDRELWRLEKHACN